MPTYEYECTNCGQVFEMFQSITAKAKRKPDEPCAKCGKKAPIRRLISRGGAVIFKGSGFYETDYRSESYKQAAKAESDSVKPKSDDSAKSESAAKPDTPGQSDAPAKSDGKPAAAPKKSKSGGSKGSAGSLARSGA